MHGLIRGVRRRIGERIDRFDAGSNLDRILAFFDAKLVHLEPLVRSSAGAPARQSFSSGIPLREQFQAKLRPRHLRRMAPVFPPLMRQMFAGGRYYRRRFTPRSNAAPEDLFAALETLARDLGAVDIGYVRDLPADAIFAGKGVPHSNAIVFTVEMDKDEIATAPSFDAFLEVAKGYRELSVVSNAITEFLRARGYAAYPGTALGGLTDYVSLAERAGLGAIGYHGLLIAPQGGARLRINTIYTNIENLPERANAHLWVRDFCAMCRKCVRSCPPSAIHDEPQEREGSGKTCIEVGACRDYFSANFGCAVCVKVCPFSDAGYEKIQRGFQRGSTDT